MGLDNLISKYKGVSGGQEKLKVANGTNKLVKIYEEMIGQRSIQSDFSEDITPFDITEFCLQMHHYKEHDLFEYVNMFLNGAIQHSFNQGHNSFFVKFHDDVPVLDNIGKKLKGLLDRKLAMTIDSAVGNDVGNLAGYVDIAFNSFVGGWCGNQAKYSSFVLNADVAKWCGADSDSCFLTCYGQVGSGCSYWARQSQFIFHGHVIRDCGGASAESTFVFLYTFDSDCSFFGSKRCDIYTPHESALKTIHEYVKRGHKLYLIKGDIDFTKVNIKQLMNHPGGAKMGLNDYLNKYKDVKANQDTLTVEKDEGIGLITDIYKKWLPRRTHFEAIELHHDAMNELKDINVTPAHILEFCYCLNFFKDKFNFDASGLFFTALIHRSFTCGHDSFRLIQSGLPALNYVGAWLYLTPERRPRVEIDGRLADWAGYNTRHASFIFNDDLGKSAGRSAYKCDFIFKGKTKMWCGVESFDSTYLFYHPTDTVTGFKATDCTFIFNDRIKGLACIAARNCTIYSTSKEDLHQLEENTLDSKLYLITQPIDYSKVEIKQLMNHPGVQRWD